MSKLFRSLMTIIMLMLMPADNKIPDNEGFTYSIISDSAVITGFEGEPEYISIPPEIEGYPVTEVRDNAFYCCISLKQISLPDSVSYMGHHCFYGCSSLESIVLPANLTEVGMGCFCGCTSLAAISIPETIASLPDSCFRACTSLDNIMIPQNVKSIENFCFSGCISLSSISLSGNLDSIGDYAFFMCNSLKSLYIPPSVEVIGDHAVGYVPGNDAPGLMKDFMLLGENDSAAMEYADENGLSFNEENGAVQAFAIVKNITGRNTAPRIFIISGSVLFGILVIIVSHFIRRENDQ